jgi:hypothetical protein
MPWWKSIAREPLVHFVAIGAVLFAIDAWRAPPDAAMPAPVVATTPSPAPTAAKPTATARTIAIDAEVRTQIADAAERRLGRAPTEAELADQTQRWIDEEILYREAVARGLDRDDPVVHQRIAGRMSYVLEQAIVMPEPTEAELRAWFEQHKDQWTKPEHVDFTHVFFAGTDATAQARATDAAAALAAGAGPERLGDRFTGGHRYRGRKPADLAAAFGTEFVDGLVKQPVGTWVQRRSRYGLHLVRIDRVDAASGASFEAARLDVRKQWLEARKTQELTAAMRKLRDGWTIEQR